MFLLINSKLFQKSWKIFNYFFKTLYCNNILFSWKKQMFLHKKLKNMKKHLGIAWTVVFPLNPFHSFLTIEILYNILLNKLINYKINKICNINKYIDINIYIYKYINIYIYKYINIYRYRTVTGQSQIKVLLINKLNAILEIKLIQFGAILVQNRFNSLRIFSYFWFFMV